MISSAKGDADQHCLAARFVDGPHVSAPDKAEQRLADWLTDLPSEQAAAISDRGRLVRCEIGQPVLESLFGFVGSGHMRSVHEPRGQTMLVRDALRG